MRQRPRIAFVVLVVPALLAGCSGSKPDAAAQQACDQLAQITRQIGSSSSPSSASGSGTPNVKAAVRRIAQTAGGSSNQAIVDAARNLASAASQGQSAVKTAENSFIQACKDAGVKRPGG